MNAKRKRAKTSPPTAAKINKANSEYWASRNREFSALIEENQETLTRPSDVLALMIGHEESCRDKETRKRDQSARASKSRPKKHPTHRSETIAAMRLSRREGRTLREFLDGAMSGSNDVGIQLAASKGVEKYIIDAEAVATDCPHVSFSTLERWWKEAGENTTTD